MSKRSKKKQARKTNRWIGIGVMGGIVLLLFALGSYNRRPIPQTTAEIEQNAVGKANYDSFCAACHGFNGEGQLTSPLEGQAIAPPHDSTGHTWHHPDSYLVDVTTNGGQVSMPAFGTTLSPAEIDGVLDYIKTFWTPAQRTQQASNSQ